MNFLPIELVSIIISYLNNKDNVSLSLTNKKLYHICNDEYLNYYRMMKILRLKSYNRNCLEVVYNWHNNRLMKPYYDAICELRKIFEPLHAKCESYCDNGFTRCPFPDCFYHRSNKYIYIEVSFYESDNIHYINRLYTPFGEVKILGGGFGNELTRLSSNFISTIKNDQICEMYDVTDKIKVYNFRAYDLLEESGPLDFHTESHNGANNTTKLYLLYFNNRFDFSKFINPKDNYEDHKIYQRVSLYKNFEHSRENFLLLSNGKNCFCYK